MKRAFTYYRYIWIKHDLPAGLSVFFVALPLCLGIALASGVPLYAGLLSGIIGGLIVTLISGSQLSVSGPAAGLTALVLSALATLGDYSLFLSAVIIAGLFQILIGILKLGVISNYFPSSVIKGMLAAIGIILISKQLPIILGYEQPDFWNSGFLQLFSSDNFLGNLNAFTQQISRGVIIISAISFIALIFSQQKFFTNRKFIPAPLLVVLAGVFINYAWTQWFPSFSLHSSQRVSIPDNVFESLSFPDLTVIFNNAEVWKFGLSIGLLASLETLLCIEAIDKLDRSNRITPVNRELLAQGVGNVICGCIGALPLTAVVVRGAANVQAGARTKMASFTHGLLLLLAVSLLSFLLNQIPYASLAAILFVTGFNLTKPSLYRHMWSLGWKQFLPFFLTIIVILGTDLLLGVCIGLLLSVYFIVRNNFKAEYKLSRKFINGIETEYIKLNSNVTFLNKVNLRKTLDEVPEYAVLTIDGSECNFIDHDILEVISEYENKAHERHIELHLIGIERVKVHASH